MALLRVPTRHTWAKFSLCASASTRDCSVQELITIQQCRSLHIWIKSKDSYLNVPNTLQWRHNGRDSVSNHQPHDCLFNYLFRRRSKKTSKLHVTGVCAGNSPVTGELPAQMTSNAENVSIWWRYHDMSKTENIPPPGQQCIQCQGCIGFVMFRMFEIIHCYKSSNEGTGNISM